MSERAIVGVIVSLSNVPVGGGNKEERRREEHLKEEKRYIAIASDLQINVENCSSIKHGEILLHM